MTTTATAHRRATLTLGQELTHRDRPAGKVRYLAFGSNLHPDRIHAPGRCPSATVVETVILEGQRLAYGNHNSKATLVPDDGASAAAVIWEIDSPSELKQLDLREGIGIGSYARHLCDVGGVSCHTYLIPTGARPDARPDRAYHGIIAKGLEHHGFDEHLAAHNQTAIGD
jgi:hypothetical protein